MFITLFQLMLHYLYVALWYNY